MSPDEGAGAPPDTRDGSRAPDARKPLATFALHAVFLGVLLSAIPAADTLYPLLFGRMADALTAPLAGEHSVRFEWVRIGARNDRGEVVMRGFEEPAKGEARATPGIARAVWEIAFSITERGYRPAALLIAAMLATPMGMRRRILATVGGVAVLQFFLLFQLWAIALALFQDQRPEVFGNWLIPLRPVIEAFFQSLLPRYVIALALWAALARPDRSIDWGPAVKLAEGLMRDQKPKP